MRAALHGVAASLAGQFVWLDVNYDDPRNAGFLADHLAATPVLMLIDPDSSAVTRLWAGTATVEQLTAFLGDATARPTQAADQALERGDALLGGNQAGPAVAAYERALAAGGAMWRYHDHAVEQLVTALQVSDPRACVQRAAAEAPHMPRNHAFVNVAVTGASCLAAEPSLIDGDGVRQLVELATRALDVPSASEDDHYQLYEALYAIRLAAGDRDGGHALAERYLAYVEHTPPPASADERMARDLARVRAALKLGVPERVIPTLEASERALPSDPDASGRLAAAYAAAQRYGDAIAACTRGLARGTGPLGALRLLTTRASAEAKAGDPAAARRDLEAARDAAARIGVASTRELMLGQVRRQLDALDAAGPGSAAPAPR